THPHPWGEGREGGPAGRPAPPPLPRDFDAPPLRRPAGGAPTPTLPHEWGQGREGGAPGAGLPCCPTCGRRVPRAAPRCPPRGEILELDPGARRLRRRTPMRRDAEPHRGPLLAGMGNFTLAAGGLTLCLAGAPLLIVLPLGITTWVMASRDLG